MTGTLSHCRTRQPELTESGAAAQCRDTLAAALALYTLQLPVPMTVRLMRKRPATVSSSGTSWNIRIWSRTVIRNIVE